MDYMSGDPLACLGEPGVAQSRRDRVGGLIYHLLFRELFEFHVMQTDPNFANYLIEGSSGDIVLLDFGSAMEYAPAFAEKYARICRAMMDDDIKRVESIACEIGYLKRDDPEAHVQRIVNIILMICEPLRHRGAYDFSASDLLARARDAGLDLVFRSGHFRAPPPETIFLHRKLVGSFLLCARIRARVDVRSVIEPFVD